MRILDYRNTDKIAIEEIQKFITFYKDVLRGRQQLPQVLQIEFSEYLTSVDELFYSYLLLFRQEFPGVKIVLDIPQNEITNQAFQLAKQHIVFLNTYYKETFIKLRTEKPLPLKHAESKEFMPHILIRGGKFWDQDKERLKMFLNMEEGEFRSFFKSVLSGNMEIWNKVSEKDVFCKKLKESIPVERISDLTWHYAIDTLSELGVLRRFCAETAERMYNSLYRIHSLNQINSDRLINSSLETLQVNGFFTFNPVQIFIFNLLVKNIHFFSSTVAAGYVSKEDFMADYKRYLVVLLNYTKDIGYGLEELAKNIVQHAGKNGNEGFGVISARIHKSYKLGLLKQDGNDFNSWFDLHEQNKCKFLDINVIDSGTKSVKTTYTENLQNEINKYADCETEPYISIRSELLKDKDTVARNYNFGRFLDFRKIELFHQIRRANARLGLLIFSDLVIRRQQGIIRFSSTDLEGEKSDCGYLYPEDSMSAHEEVADYHVDGVLDNFLTLGTNYNFIIPVELSKQEIRNSTASQGKGTPTSVLKSLFNYELVRGHASLVQTDPKKTYIVRLEKEDLPDSGGKYEKIYQLCERINTLRQNLDQSILLINAQETREVLLTSSDWIRFLACMQFSEQKDLIVYNMDFSVHQQIININRVYDSIKEFWNEKTFILFYVKYKYLYEHRVKINQRTQELSLWFCDVLHGRSFENYLLLNRSVGQYHYSLFGIIDDPVDLSGSQCVDSQFDSRLFAGDKLLNFELLIKNPDGLTLFEESVQSLLNLEICTLPDHKLLGDDVRKTDRFFCKYKGYKVSNSHFRLGSKIHISDFYYAKRIFYNSFYANRFAFLVAQYLLANNLKTVSKREKISLIGYSRYSELLVSNVRRLLTESKDGFKNINHDVVLEDNRVLKNARNLNEKIIFIIPISSTFSTSDKIKKWLDDILEKQGKKKRLSVSGKETDTDINILLVANKDYEYFDADKDLYKEFGWKKWVNGELKVLEKGENERRSFQKYFIALTTNWHPIHTCRLCFPEFPEQEQCLLETGANSVSPESIFGFPVTRIKKAYEGVTYRSYIKERETIVIKEEGPVVIKEEESVILHKHIKRDDKHYKQYIRAGKFLSIDDNRKLIRRWLAGIDINTGRDNIIIITPSRTANSGFTNMINEYLFSETATVLQYSHTDDILQNFIHFNSSLFRNSKVIFVDDVMRTAHSFHLINDYIKSIPLSCKEQEEYPVEKQKKIDYCFCIFNRLTYFEETAVLNSMAGEGRIYSFVEVNLPPIEQTNFEFPDVLKENLFDDLSRNSVTDKMKIHYLELKNKVKAYDVDFNSTLPSASIKHLFNFLVCKSLYDFFSGEFKVDSEFAYHRLEEIGCFHENQERMLEILKNYVCKDKDVCEFLNNYRGYKYEVESRIIYNCATPAFIYYKEIKEAVFVWLKKRLEKMCRDIIAHDSPGFFDDFFGCKRWDDALNRDIPSEYCDYHTLKLYLRLAVGLKINYIFSVEMFKTVKILLDELSGGKRRVVRYKEKLNDIFHTELEPDGDKEISPVGFAIYYTGLVQQIVYNEEAKAVKLVKNIVEFLGSSGLNNKLNLRNNFDNQFVRLLRMLVLENTFIFTTYHRTLYQEKLLNSYVFQHENIDNQFDDFVTFLEGYKGQSLRYEALDKMLKKYIFNSDKGLLTEGPDTGLMEAFWKTIYLKTLLQNDIKENQGDGNIKKKVNIILKYLCEILDISPEMCNGGAFFVLRYKKVLEPEGYISSEDLYNIDNFCTSDEEEIKTNVTQTNSLILKIFRGIREAKSKKPKSTFEMLYNQRLRKYDSVEIISDTANNTDDYEVIDVNKNHVEVIENQYYNNLLFLRISDIKEELRADFSSTIQFETNPQAIICFYKCNLKKCQENCARDTSYCTKSKCDETTCDKSTCAKEICYRRFDPKRLRFLLLLRDDIRAFINYHLENDSLRAFVEKDQKMEYTTSLSHNIGIYEKMINTNMKKLKEGGADKDIVQSLEMVMFYLTYKLHLSSTISKLQSKEYSLEDAFLKDKCSVKNFIDEFERNYSLILTFDNPNYAQKIDLNSVEFDAEQTKEYYEIKFSYPDGLIKEIVFEVIYNIRKYVFGRLNKISPENKLKIILEIENEIRIENDIEIETMYLIVQNNHSIVKEDFVEQQNNKFNNGIIGRHGLNLIYNCLSPFFGKNNIRLEIKKTETDKYFRIWLPIKKEIK